jgi:hypothetical protein
VDGKRNTTSTTAAPTPSTSTNTPNNSTISGSSHGSGSGSDSGSGMNSKIEAVIVQLSEFGFDRSACMNALTKLGYINADNISQEVILQSVINYLMR